VTLLLTVALAAPVEAWIARSTPSERAVAATLPVGFLEQTDGHWVRVHASPQTLDRARSAGLEVQEIAPVAGTPFDVDTVLDRLGSLDGRLVQIGVSASGSPMWGMDWGDPDGPTWRVLGGLHGDEGAAIELALALAEAIDERAVDGLDERHVQVVPLLNPDGASVANRYNARNVDLNRNWDYAWDESEFAPGAHPFSERETRAARTLALTAPATAGLSLHSGATNIGWVWNHTTDRTVDDTLLDALAELYVEACSQTAFYSTNGADWYVTRGDSTDWTYGRQGTLDFTLEVSSLKTPSGSTLDGVLDAHLAALASWLAQPAALTGQVVHASTGLPLPAVMSLDGSRDFQNDVRSGRFERLAAEGPRWLTVSSPGFESVTLEVDLPTEEVVALEPATLLTLRPEPALVSKGGDGHTFIDMDEVTLTRPGWPPTTLDGPDVFVPSDLPAGLYDIVTNAGTAPRALFVGYGSDRVAIDAVTLESGIQIHGVGFGAGSEVTAYWGLARSPVALAILSESDSLITVDASGLPTTEPVDLLVDTSGAELAVVDVLGAALLDTPPADTGFYSPSLDEDTGKDTGDEAVVEGGCGCHGAPAGLMWLTGPLAVLWRRSS